MPRSGFAFVVSTMIQPERAVDFSSVQYLNVQGTDVPNAWRVRLPRRPWVIRRAERERDGLLAKLTTAHPHRALWLSDWASDERHGWRPLNVHQSLAPYEHELSKGAWVLFFFDDERRPPLDAALPPGEPADPSAATRTLEDVGGAAGIWSWYDDTEWLLVLA